MTEAQFYIAGWNACMAGVDGRYADQASRTVAEQYAWMHGWLDAMVAEDGEEPEPSCAGFFAKTCRPPSRDPLTQILPYFGAIVAAIVIGFFLFAWAVS